MKWSQKVKTVSTFPPKGIFTKSAKTIADTMAKPEVSPKGITSAIRMVQFYINRAGKNLKNSRRQELEGAKRLLKQQKEAK
jgi:hypothetical protein